MSNNIAEQCLKYIKEGDLIFSNGKFNESIEIFKKVIELDPNNQFLYNARAYNGIGCCYYSLEDCQESLKWFNLAIEKDPNVKFYYQNKAKSLIKLCQYEQAIQCYEKSISLSGSSNSNENGDDYYCKGYCQHKLQLYTEAVKSFESALWKNENAMILNAKGNSHKALREYDKALICFTRAVELNPSKAEYRQNKQEIESLIQSQVQSYQK